MSILLTLCIKYEPDLGAYTVWYFIGSELLYANAVSFFIHGCSSQSRSLVGSALQTFLFGTTFHLRVLP